MDFSLAIQRQINDIILNAPTDFTGNLRGEFSEQDLKEILSRAEIKLHEKIDPRKNLTAEELAQYWNEIVGDFYHNEYWGFQTRRKSVASKKETTPAKQLTSYIRAFIVPTLLLKAGILYYGLNYSSHPDEGYGYGLFFTVTLSLLNFAIFIWKTRNNTDL